MIKYIIGTLIKLFYKLINLKCGKKVIRIDPKVPWYRQLLWFYSNPTKIVSNLYLGSSFNAYDLEILKKLNINVIINVTKEMGNFHQDNLKLTYYKYPIYDDNNDDISDILTESCEIIDYHLNTNDIILVHCYMGASRSASVVINYLMFKLNLNYKSALAYVKEKRPIINLSEKFNQTLIQSISNPIAS